MKDTLLARVNDMVPDISVIREAASVLKSGGIVGVPTETVYGLAADWRNKKAVEKLYDIKKRPHSKPFSILVNHKNAIDEFASSPPRQLYKIVAKFWPGPVTVVFPRKNKDMIGLRMPDNATTLSLITESGLYLAAPSANFSGDEPCVNADDVFARFNGIIDMVLDAGESRLKRESSVVKVDSEGEVEVLRESAVSGHDLQRTAKMKKILFVCTGNSCRSVMAEALLRDRLKDRHGIEVSSAGISALPGMAATDYTVFLLAKNANIDISAHKATLLTEDILKSADIILPMERSHEERINVIAPSVKNRVFLLKEFARIKDGNMNIKDPIGGSLEVYMNVFYTIRDAVDRMAESL